MSFAGQPARKRCLSARIGVPLGDSGDGGPGTRLKRQGCCPVPARSGGNGNKRIARKAYTTFPLFYPNDKIRRLERNDQEIDDVSDANDDANNDAERPPAPSASALAEAGPAAVVLAESAPEAPRIDTGLLCFVMLAQFLEVPVDAEQIRHQAGKPGEVFTDTDLLRVAKGLGFKASAVTTDWTRLEKTPLPAIAQRKDGTFFILAKVGKAGPEAGEGAGSEAALIQCPVAGRPQTLARGELEEQWDGTLILLTTRKQLAGEQRRFDISWFIPAVVKYRQLFGEVIVASFFIQVFALISPLFFMVIIDKVLVHRGLSSLDVLIFALVVVSIFEVLLGGYC